MHWACRKAASFSTRPTSPQVSGNPSNALMHSRVLDSNAQSLRLCASARTSRPQSPARPKNWFTWRRGAVALRENEAPPNVFGRKTKRPQPEPPRHTRTFSASPRESVLLAVTVCDDGRFCSREGAKARRYGAWISAYRLSLAAKN